MIDVLFGLQSRADRAVTDDFWYNPIAAPNSTAGIAVTEELAMTYATVYACANKIAKTVATLPVHVYKTLPDDKKEKVSDHALATIWRGAPNPEMTAVTFRECMMLSILLWGNAYAEIVYTNGGEVAQLWPLLAREITMLRTDAGDILYEYRPAGVSQPTYFTPRRMLHIVGLSYNGLLGVSVIGYQREAIGLGMGATTMGAALFGNMAVPGLVIQHPGPRRMSKPAYDRLKQSIDEDRTSATNAHKTMLLEEGAEAKALGIPPDDAQFLETRMFQRVDICGIFDTPPSKIQDDTRSTYDNIEQKNIDWVTDTIVPWCVRIESAVNTKFLSDTDYYVKHNVDGLKRGSFIERQEGYSFGRNGGWLSRNDIRRMEDMDPIPGGDDYLTPVNMTTLGEEPEPVAQQLPAPGGKQPFPPPKAFRPLFEDAMGRVLAKEKKAILNAWKKHAKGGTVETFSEWAASFYTEHEQYVADALRPIFQSQPTGVAEAIAAGFAQRYVSSHLGEVRLTIANSPDVLSATVALWESEYFVDHLLEIVA